MVCTWTSKKFAVAVQQQNGMFMFRKLYFIIVQINAVKI